MGYWEDMQAALVSYPADDVTLEVVDVAFAVGTVLNVSEEMAFKIKITNLGALNLTDVTLRVKGQHGATLKNPIVFTPNVPAGALAIVAQPVLWVSELVSAPIANIGAHGGTATTGTFTLKAPATAQASQTLVKASLEQWNANTNHIFDGHSDPLPNAPTGTYSTAVIAQ